MPFRQYNSVHLCFHFSYNFSQSRHFVGNIHSASRQIALHLWDFDGLMGFGSFLDWLKSLKQFFYFHDLSDSSYLSR